MSISKILAAAAAAILAGNMIAAQDFEARIKADREFACNVYKPYSPAFEGDTKAPSGYKAFYISHYGRHGSRYHLSESSFARGVQGLEAAAEAGLLTDEGKALSEDFFKVFAEHQGMYGQLSRRGAREHRGIAERMYKTYPGVFKNKERREVSCISSPIQRCIISMANFTISLKEQAPAIDLSFDTGERYFEYICHDVPDQTASPSVNAVTDSLRRADCTYDELFARIFTDPAKAEALIDDPQRFVKSLYLVGAICYDHEWIGADLFRFFSDEELTQQARIENIGFYGKHGNSLEWGHNSHAADLLVGDFVEKADAALQGSSHRAADLRFGHDTGILPLAGLIGIEEFAERVPMLEAEEHGKYCSELIPMGSNFQMIFYRSKKGGDVLVKLRYNERETTIPALEPVTGPYYSWPALREYLLSVSK